MLAQVDKDIHFALVTNWKQPKCPSGGEWGYKSQFVNAVACYPGVRENKEDLNEWVRKALQDTLSGDKKKQIRETYTLHDPVYVLKNIMYLSIHTCMSTKNKTVDKFTPNS